MRILETYDAAFSAARSYLLEALESPEPGPGERLFRWMDLSDINAWEIFADPELARSMGTAEGAAGVLQALNRALQGDGAISYPVTAWHGPKLALIERSDPGFEEAFQRQIEAHGHGETVIDSHRIIGFCSDMDAFITSFDQHRAEMKAIFDDLHSPDP